MAAFSNVVKLVLLLLNVVYSSNNSTKVIGGHPKDVNALDILKLDSEVKLKNYVSGPIFHLLFNYKNLLIAKDRNSDMKYLNINDYSMTIGKYGKYGMDAMLKIRKPSLKSDITKPNRDLPDVSYLMTIAAYPNRFNISNHSKNSISELHSPPLLSTDGNDHSTPVKQTSLEEGDMRTNNAISLDDGKGVHILVEQRLEEHCKEVAKRNFIKKFIHFLDSSGKFSDLNYSSRRNWRPIKQHWQRLGAVATHELEVTGFLSQRTLNSFAFLAYELPKLTDENWWTHLIGIPQSVYPALFIGRKFISNETMSRLLDRYFTNTVKGSVWNCTLFGPGNSGGNLAPRALLGLIEGVLRNNLQMMVRQIKAPLYEELVEMNPWQGNGLREDGCIHQHNLRTIVLDNNFGREVILAHVYNNAYGKEFFKNWAVVIWAVSGTSLSFGAEIEKSILWAFFACQQWLYRGQVVEPTSTGRFINSGNLVTRFGGLDGVQGTLKYLQKLRPRSTEVAAALHRYENAIPENNYALQGNRYFFKSDLMSHQRQDFMATLRLLSIRTLRPETWISLNSKGYYQGDGFLSVLVTTKEFGSPDNEIFQVYNWAFIPGVTCPSSSQIPEVPTDAIYYLHGYNNSTFVGGVSDGRNGLAAMVYSRLTVSVVAKKSWHFFEGFIAAMGTGITGKLPHSDQQISTTLNQVIHQNHYTFGCGRWAAQYNSTGDHLNSWKSKENESCWIHHGSLGYLLLNFSQLHISVDLKSHKKKNMSLFRAWIDHGCNPENESYGYVLLPGFTAEQTRHFASQNSLEVIAQNEKVHGVCFDGIQASISFFESECVDLIGCANSTATTICTNEPVAVLLRSVDNPISDDSSNVYSKCKQLPRSSEYTDNGVRTSSIDSLIRVTVSDPSQELESVEIILKTLHVESKRLIILPISPYRGASCYSYFPLSNK